MYLGYYPSHGRWMSYFSNMLQSFQADWFETARAQTAGQYSRPLDWIILLGWCKHSTTVTVCCVV
jgi:hypothetical protein